MQSVALPTRPARRPGHALSRAALAVGSRAADALLPGRGCCFTFHRAAPSSEWGSLPNRGFHLDLGYLERLVAHLLHTGWDVVTMEEAHRRSAASDPRRFVNFSVDDCYRDTAELVVPLFRRLGAPVTLFVTTGIPDGTFRLRDAGLETILHREDRVSLVEGGRLSLSSARSRRDAFAMLSRQWDGPDGDAAYAAFCALNAYDPDELDALHAISWDMLRHLARDPLVEIGAHTVSHPRVSSLSAEAGLRELAASRERLRALLGVPARHFAFPYGRAGDCGPREFAMAQLAGYASAATTRKGLVARGAAPLGWPRNTLNGNHRSLPLAYGHLTGVSGLLAAAMGRV